MTTREPGGRKPELCPLQGQQGAGARCMVTSRPVGSPGGAQPCAHWARPAGHGGGFAHTEPGTQVGGSKQDIRAQVTSRQVVRVSLFRVFCWLSVGVSGGHRAKHAGSCCCLLSSWRGCQAAPSSGPGPQVRGRLPSGGRSFIKRTCLFPQSQCSRISHVGAGVYTELSMHGEGGGGRRVLV